jgi:hypothetical protein
MGKRDPTKVKWVPRNEAGLKWLFKRLWDKHRIDEIDASERLHEIKRKAGLGPADHPPIDRTGNVYSPTGYQDPETRELLGSLTTGWRFQEEETTMKNRNYTFVYAIIRSDDYLGEGCPVEERMTVKMVVWDEEEANREVTRLNALQKHNGSRYFWQATRLIKKEQPAGQKASLVTDETAIQAITIDRPHFPKRFYTSKLGAGSFPTVGVGAMVGARN